MSKAVNTELAQPIVNDLSKLTNSITGLQGKADQIGLVSELEGEADLGLSLYVRLYLGNVEISELEGYRRSLQSDHQHREPNDANVGGAVRKPLSFCTAREDTGGQLRAGLGIAAYS